MHHPDLKSIDPMLCISLSARENFEKSFSPDHVRDNLYNSALAESVH